MKDDPIVAEVREARAALLAECDGDLGKLMQHLRDRESRHAERVLSLDDVKRRHRSPGSDPG